MVSRLRHRGPDDGGTALFPEAALGFRRLALLDLERGNQPVTDERRRWWSVFNGEIYNHAELHEQLARRGHRLLGHGDAELIPHLAEEWGPDFVTRLRGMFAIAVYDAEARELLLARDAFGIKPLYYAQTASHLVFASEARAILASGAIEPEVDPVSTWHYFGFGYVPDPASMWQGVRKVPPGHVLRVADGRSDLRCWWTPTFSPAAGGSLQSTADRVEAALRDSVQVHLRADVEVGAYLSSGVDSSLITALACQRTSVRTFSVGFEGPDGTAGELGPARALADRLGTRHHEEVISARAYRDALPQIVAGQEDPLADPSAPALWFLARAASREVKAVVSGEGADELFAGYPIFRQPRALRAFELMPAEVRSGLGRLAGLLPDGVKGKGFLQRASTPLAQRFLGSTPVHTEAQQRALLARGLPTDALPRAAAELVRPHYDATAGLDDVVRMQLVSLHTWLPSSILMKADKMGMAHSLEVRVPFLDRAVFDVASSVPLAHRVGRHGTKLALRAAAERILPSETARRPKLGFPVPFRAWLDGELGRLCGELLDGTTDPLLDRTAARRLSEGGGSGRYRRKWALLMYLLWREAFAEPPA